MLWYWKLFTILTLIQKAHNALYELVSDAICEKLGNKNGDGTCSFDG